MNMDAQTAVMRDELVAGFTFAIGQIQLSIHREQVPVFYESYALKLIANNLLAFSSRQQVVTRLNRLQHRACLMRIPYWDLAPSIDFEVVYSLQITYSHTSWSNKITSVALVYDFNYCVPSPSTRLPTPPVSDENGDAP